MAPPSPDIQEVLGQGARMEDLHEARRRFLEDGVIMDTVRPVVRAAWKRCQEYDIHPHDLRRQQPDPDRLNGARKESRPLLESAEPLLQFVHETLGSSPHLCYLTDAHGTILRVLTDPGQDMDALGEYNLIEGASRLECAVGCTAAGTALAEEKPVLLLGPEHLQNVFVDWTCVGVPVHDGTGDIAGVLSLSVPNNHISIHTWGWMFSVGREIELNIQEKEATRKFDSSLANVNDPLNAVRGVLELLTGDVELSPTHAAIVARAQCAAEQADVRLRSLVAKLHRSQSQLEEANRNRETFLAMLAHEMAGPLSALKMCIELIGRKASDAEAVGRLSARMERLVERLLRLLEDLRDVSSISQGKIKLEKKPLKLAGVIKQAVETVEPLIEERGHHLCVDVEDKPLVVLGDSDRLVQVVSNLLTNAAKYTEPEGQIWLRAQDMGERVELSVRDTGIGIPQDMAPHIFELFEQGGERKQGGLGIGLNLVQHLVQLHDGRVEVYSDGEGTGSKFVVELPMAAMPVHEA